MAFYIGVKLLEAEPMNLGDYNKYRGWTIPDNEDPNREGYLVKYDNSYESWSPKEIFESAYFKIENNNKLSETDIDNFMQNSTKAISDLGSKTTVIHFKLPNGWEDVKSSSCVDPVNYSQVLGSKLCIEHMKNDLWRYLGFILQWAKHGLKV